MIVNCRQRRILNLPPAFNTTRVENTRVCMKLNSVLENFTAYLVQYLEFDGSYVPLMIHEAQELVCEHVTFDNYSHPDVVLLNQTG